jgi:multidrug efflux system outer membrane protein
MVDKADSKNTGRPARSAVHFILSSFHFEASIMLIALNRTTLAVSVALVTLLVMAGCTTVGPDFVAPVANAGAVGASYRHQAQPETVATNLPPAWWRVFGDLQLDRLEQVALQDNPGIKAAAQRLLQAQAQAGGVRASARPTIGASASLANARTSANTSQALALGGRAIDGNAYAVGAALSYEIDLWGRVRRLSEAADAQVQLAGHERDGVLQLLSAQVAQTYWQLRGLDAEMTILQSALETRRETEQLLQARFDAGLSGELDGARARVERANAEADLHEAKRQRNLFEHALATLTGVAPSALLQADSTDSTDSMPVAPVIPAGLPATLLAQRPDLAGSVALLRAQNAQIGVAEAAFYPSLQLTGNLGYASQNLRDLGQGGSRQLSVGPLALSLPLFDGGRNNANLALAKARYQETLANHESKLLNALREVEDALSNLEQRQLQGQAQAQAQQAAARAYLVAQARYERGLSSFLDVIDAQRSTLALDRASVQIRTQRLLETVALARALGAGWQVGEPEPAMSSLVETATVR